ncbi:MAG: 5'-3' exonuclease H3TH domain-containing protein, partial [Dehalococcoidia bacterium]|nr:5'-3' exonuclease H3TH domain-containing protein [Dehalococcoidia bacterium]
MTDTAPTEILLIDLSAIAHPIWHMSQREPDPDYTSTQIVARVRALASGHREGVAVCCDSGRSFRHDLSPDYKATRPPAEATLLHQIAVATDTLRGDGFPVWALPGFEADDVIASATAHALRTPDLTVRIVTADKDLLQLVGARVVVQSLRDGATLDAAAVREKFGVAPSQMRDYLSLVGDSSDNIAGAKGVGPRKAAELLQRYGSLDALYHAIGQAPDSLTPGLARSLAEFQPRLAMTRALLTL